MGFGRGRISLNTASALCALGFLWFVLIRHLSVEWSVNEQYAYGWAVPPLCLYLLWKSFRNMQPAVRSQEAGQNDPSPSNFGPAPVTGGILFLALAFLYLPTRLVQEANPEWRLVSWALSLEVVGVTLVVAPIFLKQRGLAKVAFPILFFLVAVPWPTFIESPVIQGLTRANTAVTVELLSWSGTPALQRGNVIEIAAGAVGIDEACSGIRSFQAALMISLFLGESYRLSLRRRVGLVLCGFGLSLGFNLLRTLLLVSIAARKGLMVMQTWHDPAGIAVLLGCFCGIWGLGAWFSKDAKAKMIASDTIASVPAVSDPGIYRYAGITLVLWIVATEVGVEFWYRAHETGRPAAKLWTVHWPEENPTYRRLPMADAAHRLLRYDEAFNATWMDEGAKWQVILFRWKPGRTASRLAAGHTPEFCLTAAGRNPVASSESKIFDVNGLAMPFRLYELANEEIPLHVFYCLWNERDSQRSFNSTSMTYSNRFRPVLQGERNGGQRSLEVAVWGFSDPGAAESAFVKQIKQLIRVAQ